MIHADLVRSGDGHFMQLAKYMYPVSGPGAATRRAVLSIRIPLWSTGPRVIFTSSSPLPTLANFAPAASKAAVNLHLHA